MAEPYKSDSGLLAGLRKAVGSNPEISTALTFFIIIFAATRLMTIGRTVYHRAHSFCQSHSGMWYVVGYDEGFTRRGFIGTLVSLFPGTDSPLTVLVIASLLSATAVILLTALAISFARLSTNPVKRLVLFAVVFTSPLYASTLISDWGRLDNVGILCGGISLFVLLRERIPLSIGMVTSSVVIAVAAATEEFLPMHLIPLAAIALWSRLSIGRAHNLQFIYRYLFCFVVLSIPALLIMFASAGTPVTPGFVESIAYRTGMDIDDISRPGTPLWAMIQSSQSAVSFTHSIPYQYATILLSGSVFGLTVLCIYLLLRPTRIYWILVLSTSGIGFSLCMIGADARRWWALSLITLIASCVALVQPGNRNALIKNSDEPPTHRMKLISTLTVLAVLTLSMIGQKLPLWGGTFVDWIKSLYHAFIF